MGEPGAESTQGMQDCRYSEQQYPNSEIKPDKLRERSVVPCELEERHICVE